MMNEQLFVEASPFNKSLFYFLIENHDCFMLDKVDKIMEMIEEAYRLCGGVVRSQSPVIQISTYIEYVESSYHEISSLILAIVWTALSVHKTKCQFVKSITNILNKKLSSLRWFPFWKHFVSAYIQEYGHVALQFPENSTIKISEVTNVEEAMSQALQSEKESFKTSVSDIHQTLVFPHVEQFYNNPAKVFNYNLKK